MDIGTAVYVNGTNNRYNFCRGVVSEHRNYCVRVTLYDLGRPVTINVPPHLLTPEDVVIDYTLDKAGDVGLNDALRALRPRRVNFLQMPGGRIDAIPGGYDRRFMVINDPHLADGVAAEKAALEQCINDSRVIGMPEALGAPYGLTVSAAHLLAQSQAAQETMFAVHNNLIAQGAVLNEAGEYEMPGVAGVPSTVVRDVNGERIGVNPDIGFVMDFDGSAKRTRDLLAMLRANGWLSADTAGKTAVERAHFACGPVVTVMHRHSRKTIVTLSVE